MDQRTRAVMRVGCARRTEFGAPSLGVRRVTGICIGVDGGDRVAVGVHTEDVADQRIGRHRADVSRLVPGAGQQRIDHADHAFDQRIGVKHGPAVRRSGHGRAALLHHAFDDLGLAVKKNRPRR